MLQRQELILLRHGQSTANASGIWQGQLDFPLSDEGRRQARLAGKALSGTPLDAVYTSPLSRAYETAELVAREAGFTGGIVAEPGLVERAGGSLEGTTREDRAARSPEMMRKLACLPEEEHWEIVGAETDEEVLRRFGAAVSRIRSRHEAGGRIVIVSHGGAMRAFLRDALGPGVLPDSERAPNASITRLAWEPNSSTPHLLELAVTDHLYEETGLAGE